MSAHESNKLPEAPACEEQELEDDFVEKLESGEHNLVTLKSQMDARQNSVIDTTNNPIEIRSKPSPKRAVHVRSPVKYSNGHFQLPEETLVPQTQGKPVSSFDVIEGSASRHTRTHTQFRGKSDRQLLATETNFFAKSGEAPGHLSKERQTERKRVRSNFPQIMERIMEQTQGSFSRDGPDKYINEFFKDDFISSPKYRHDMRLAKRMMEMRVDSRGSPLRRTYLGNSELFNQGKRIFEDRQMPKNRPSKFSSALPAIEAARKVSIKRQSDVQPSMDSSRAVQMAQQSGSPGWQKGHINHQESIVSQASIRADSSLKRDSAAWKRNHLHVGFQSNQQSQFQTISGSWAQPHSHQQLLVEDGGSNLRLDITNSQLLSSPRVEGAPLIENILSINSSSPSPLHVMSSFTSNLTARMAQAMSRHTSVQFKWLKQIEQINKRRNDKDLNTTYHKKKLQRSLRDSSLGSLIERQMSFAYDAHGSKKPGFFWGHKSPQRDEENPADLQNRVNTFYQDVRGSDVAYVTTQTRNEATMLWSTSPTGRSRRGKGIDKDIAKQPVKRRRSKVFRGYNKTIEPSEHTYNSKSPKNTKNSGCYLDKLAAQREKGFTMHSYLQSSVDMAND